MSETQTAGDVTLTRSRQSGERLWKRGLTWGEDALRRLPCVRRFRRRAFTCVSSDKYGGCGEPLT